MKKKLDTKQVDFKKIAEKWQKNWNKENIFQANVDYDKEKFFINIPYPYVNGAPHIGAGFTFIRGDIYARFKRMQGFNVLLPQGFHATGEPIVGAVKRIKEGDESQIEAFKIYGISEKEIKKFAEEGPEYVAKFWKERWVEDLTNTGFSIDWRRTFITTPITPTYSRFIEWQYNTLKERGYVTQGTHPVVWCPKCESPTGDHDRLEGVGESPIEYIIIKFRLASGEVLPCGTLRPETVYGVTNIWIHPEVEYVKVNVDGEKWVLSESAAEKLKDQLKEVEVVGKVKGSEIVGKVCENPLTGKKIPVFPADFCDTSISTGIVMSVPSHAPYDWMGLEDLKNDEELQKKYGLEKLAKSVEPISIISVKGFGEHPAKEVCDEMGVKSQKDASKLEKATELLYKKEFHTGTCKENCGRYAGMKVSEAKDLVIEDLMDEDHADRFWETTATVKCRCNQMCHIKNLENQWFLKYSDEDWKKKAHKCIDKMTFYPEDVRQQFHNTVDWLHDKACTRKSGMGTPLPWDKSWIVETLSDSTIYMAYYTIANTIKENGIKAGQMPDELFDYIFFGEGDIKVLSEKCKLDEDVINKLREEFDYFYPVDLRTSGKDLVQNHLTFFIFQHVALWDEEKWPQAIGINGYVNVGGEKMSKSKGNFIPLRDLLKKYGPDIVRINIAASNENMDDADWREDSVPTYASRLNYLFEFVSQMKKAEGKGGKKIEDYLNGRMHQIITESTQAYDEMKFRSATQHALFSMSSEIKNYIDRVGGIENCSKDILKHAADITIRMISPLVPHVSEELWSKLGNDGFVSVAEWPKVESGKIDKKIVMIERTYQKTLRDIKEVSRLVEKEPEKLYLYFATEEELEYFEDSEEHLKKIGFDEVSLLLSRKEGIYDPQNKAEKAKFGRPGIYVE